MSQAKQSDLWCEHLDEGGRKEHDCGMYLCSYSSCDACYEGHLLEQHMFVANPHMDRPGPYRLMLDIYSEATRKRATWAKRILEGL